MKTLSTVLLFLLIHLSSILYADDSVKVDKIPANIVNSKHIPVSVTSYAGYAVADEECGNRLFYWFFESQTSRYHHTPDNIPLVIWLEGGPGIPSTLSLLLENGPFEMQNNDTASIIPNPNTWNKEVHMLYWDQPVGTGYSYSTQGEKCYVTNEKDLTTQFYTALQNFYKQYPKYRQCPLYITGESYAGKYNLSIADEILKQNQKGENPVINLKGVAIGDGWINPEVQTLAQIDFAFSAGIIDSLQKKQAMNLYRELIKALEQQNMTEANQLDNQISQLISSASGTISIYDISLQLQDMLPVNPEIMAAYLNTPTVKKALNVPDQVTWAFSSNAVSQSLAPSIMVNATHFLPTLLDQNLELLMYTGSLDTVCGFLGIEKVLYHLPWKHTDEWQNTQRKIWVNLPKETLGYIKTVENLIQINIPDAGHMVAMEKPALTQNMIFNWIFKREFTAYIPADKQKVPDNQDTPRLPEMQPFIKFHTLRYRSE